MEPIPCTIEECQYFWQSTEAESSMVFLIDVGGTHEQGVIEAADDARFRNVWGSGWKML